MSESLMNPQYQQGWNTALIDMAEGKMLTCIDPMFGADYEEGYFAGQDYALMELSLLREEQP